MRIGRQWGLLSLLVLALGAVSCWPSRRTQKTVIAPAPRPTPVLQPKHEIPPPQLPSPPQIDLSSVSVPPSATPEKPPELPPPPKKRARAYPSEVPAQHPAPTPADLRPIFTPQQRQALDRLISERLGRARQALVTLQGRQLTKKQSDTVLQIKVFILQAEETRKRDPVRGSNLAERADILARDLLDSLR